MKNIAIIVQSLNGGGAERIAGLLSKELEKYYNVYLFLYRVENIVYEYGGKIVDIGDFGPFYEYSISLKKEKYHIDCSISFLEPMNFANIRTKRNERVLISERCVQSCITPQHNAQALKIQRYYNYADEIVACSEGVKYDLEYNYNVHGNISTVYNFINKESIILRSREILPDEVQNFLNGEEFFVNVGRLHPQKNHKRLLLQFSYFHTINGKVKLLIIGSGKLEGELKSYIMELGIIDCVKIIPYTKNPFKYIAKSKALILASRYEGLPNVVLEAMTLRCPVVAVDCLAGPRELLQGEKDYKRVLDKLEICKRGILVCNDKTEDDGTTRYMARAMKLICTSNAIIDEIKHNGQKYMEQYTNQKIVEEWCRIIEGSGQRKYTNIFFEEEKVLGMAKHIVIYGAGIIGKNVFLRLSKLYKIDYFVVSNQNEEETEFQGIPVKGIRKLEYSPNDTAVVIGVGYGSQDNVVRTLQELKFTQIVFPYMMPMR